MPMLTPGSHFGKDASGKIILMPARHDQYNATAWAHARQQVGLVPFEVHIPDMLAIGVGPGPDRVVDHRQIGAKAGNADANTQRNIHPQP